MKLAAWPGLKAASYKVEQAEAYAALIPCDEKLQFSFYFKQNRRIQRFALTKHDREDSSFWQ